MQRWVGLIIAALGGFILGTWSPCLTEWKPFHKPKKAPVFAVTEHKPFVIVVPSFNNSEWVKRNLKSIFAQKYDNYRVIYIDDASSDNTLKLVCESVETVNMGHRVKIIHNETNKGACENIFRAMHSCEEGEIALVVDGDDWLAHEHVLERLNEIYANPDVWMTYGSYIEYPSYRYTVANFAQPLPKEVIEKNTIRKFSRKHWYLAHLRSFYVSLFKKIQEKDLLLDGQFYKAAADVGWMIPMVEMAGQHVRYVDEVFYIYNRATPLNDHKVRAKQQQQIAEYIFNLPSYTRLTELSGDNTCLR